VMKITDFDAKLCENRNLLFVPDIFLRSLLQTNGKLGNPLSIYVFNFFFHFGLKTCPFLFQAALFLCPSATAQNATVRQNGIRLLL